MTERILEIPNEGDFSTPEGWYVIQYYYGNVMLRSTGRPSSVRITDDPDHPEIPTRLTSLVSESENTAPGELHPDYYRTVPGMQPWDIIRAYGLDYWKGTVLAYLLRAGKKDGSSEYDDIRKAYTFLGEHLRDLEKADHPAHEFQIDEGPT